MVVMTQNLRTHRMYVAIEYPTLFHCPCPFGMDFLHLRRQTFRCQILGKQRPCCCRIFSAEATSWVLEQWLNSFLGCRYENFYLAMKNLGLRVTVGVWGGIRD